MVGVLVVDDNLKLRGVLRTIIDKRPGFHVVGEAADGISAAQLTKAFVRTWSSWMSECRAWMGSRRPATFGRFFLIPRDRHVLPYQPRRRGRAVGGWRQRLLPKRHA